MTAAAPPPAAAAATHGWHARKKRLLMALLGGLVGLEFMENAMFVFAASHIVGGVDAAPREFAQVQAAYAVGSMLMIVLQQALARRLGYRRYLAGALALFMAGAAACAGADGLAALTLARLVQGFGGGALFTSSRVLVPLLFPPAERPRALKWFMLVLFGMSAAGPLLAARLVEDLSWRFVFLAALPVGAVLLAGAWMLLPDRVGRGGMPVRWAAAPLLLGAAALTVLQVVLSMARFDVFVHPVRLALAALAGAALLAAFLVHQWHHDEPLLRLRELRHPVYVMGLVLYFLHYLLSNAANYVFPIFAERGLGVPLATTGLLDTFAAAVSFAGAWVYVKTAARLPRKKPLMAAGAVLLAAAAWGFSRLPADAPAAMLLPALVAKGLFGVMLVLPVAGLTFRDLGDERFAHGYQSKNLMRQIAGSFATALAAVALQDREFAGRDAVAATLAPSRPGVQDWVDRVQAGFAAHGDAAGQAHAAALAALARTVDQQVQLIACQDLYRGLAVLAVAAAVVVLAQRRLA
jgi:MFS family permease